MDSLRNSGWTRRRTLAAATLAASTLPALACARSGPAANNALPAPARLSGTVTLWHNWALRTPQLKVYLSQFEQEHPGVTVEEATESVVGGRDKLVAAILAGTPPDALNLFPAMYLLLIPGKAVVDLKKYVTRDKLDTRLFIQSDLQSRTVDGQLVSLPAQSGSVGIQVYWNKDHYREAGLDPEAAPKTWADLAQFARRLTVKQGDTVSRLGMEPVTGLGAVKNDTGARFAGWLYTNDGKLYSDDGRKVAFNTREAIDTVTWLAQTVKAQGAGPLYDLGAARTAFYQGKLSILVEADLLPSLIRIDPIGKDLKWGISALPANERNPRAKALTGNRGGHGYAVMSGGKNQEGAWALTRFLAAGDAQCGFMVKEQGRFSTLARCNTTPDALNLQEFKVFSKMAELSVPVPFTPGDTGAVQALETRVQDALVGKLSPEAAIQQATQEAQLALDDGWRQWTR